MEELKAMVKAVMDSLIEMTARAVTAEAKAEQLAADLEKVTKDRDSWKGVFLYESQRNEKLEAELKEFKDKQAEDESYHISSVATAKPTSEVLPS